MIVAFSTSSPVASVALLTEDGALIGASEELAPMAASGACLRLLGRLLQDTGLELKAATLFLSDLGPGSFTGVRVGVTLAKTLAYAQDGLTGGASSFDLIDPSGTVVLPNKRNEWFVRRPGSEAVRTSTLPDEPFTGFGPEIENPIYPSASRFSALLARIERIQPELLVPGYLVEPAISKPKQPFGAGGPGKGLPGPR